MTSPNLRSADQNPFRVSRLEKLKWIPYPDNVDKIYNIWKEDNFRGQITGKHGAGKSTLAQRIMDKAEEEGHNCLYLFANTESLKVDFKNWDQKLKECPKSTLIVFDGLCHASKWRQRRLLKRFPHCLALIHEGIDQLPLTCHLEPNSRLLAQLVNELSKEESQTLLEQAGGAEKLFHKHNANIRDCLFELYEIWSNG